MRILVAHNEYKEPGGEDQVFAAEIAMLRNHGHEVRTWTESNRRIEENATAAISAVWSRESYRHLASLIQQHQPDIVHAHNTFYRLSPAIFYACHQSNTPVVLTLHNYRLLCPAATLFRDGHICEDCTGWMGYWPGIRHRCWQDSYARTSVVASTLVFHKWLGTWHKQIDTYITLTNFARDKFVEWGLPRAKVAVKPNFVNSAKSEPAPSRRAVPSPYALFVGRLTAEKGVRTLLSAWRELPDIPLRILGDGPLAEELAQTVAQEQMESVELCGRLPHAEVIAQMRGARFLVFPSTWYEGFPMTIVEAFASGLPVIGSKIGSIAEVVEDGINGLHFEPGSAQALASKVRWAWGAQAAMQEMGQRAYAIYRERYTENANYARLIDIYEQAINARAPGATSASA